MIDFESLGGNFEYWGMKFVRVLGFLNVNFIMELRNLGGCLEI